MVHEFSQLEGYKASQGVRDAVAQHADIIARFGRYPHRNAALGRQSTPEEVEYLNGSHNHFGQGAPAPAPAPAAATSSQ